MTITVPVWYLVVFVVVLLISIFAWALRRIGVAVEKLAGRGGV